jgi:hypothetical protein
VRKLIASLIAVAALAAGATADTASAATLFSPGAVTGGGLVGSAGINLGLSRPLVTCTSFTMGSFRYASNTLSTHPVSASCSTLGSGGGTVPIGVTVTPSGSCDWQINGTGATYNSTSGVTTGLRVTVCSFDLAFSGCDVTISSQTVSTGVTAQNRNSLDTSNAPPSSPGGFRLLFNNTPMTYTSTGCGFSPSTGTATVTATWFFGNAWFF